MIRCCRTDANGGADHASFGQQHLGLATVVRIQRHLPLDLQAALDQVQWIGDWKREGGGGENGNSKLFKCKQFSSYLSRRRRPPERRRCT